jgi:hypothetical protein
MGAALSHTVQWQRQRWTSGAPTCNENPPEDPTGFLELQLLEDFRGTAYAKESTHRKQEAWVLEPEIF